MHNISIIMPSYNRGKYIAEALDSILMQETCYTYKIIIADDHSTDETIEIVKQYQEKYKNKIILLESEKNQKLYKNILRAYEIIKSDYFCVLDPDDFWTDKNKIQKAIDFLEANIDYTIYTTNTDLLMSDGSSTRFLNAKKNIDSGFSDFLTNKAVLGHTSGTIFRNVVFKKGIPEKMKKLTCETQLDSFRGDTFRNLLHLHEGKAHCVPEVSSVYRITDEGIWQGISTLDQEILNAVAFKDIWFFFDMKYPELLVISYKIFQRMKKNLISGLGAIKVPEKLAMTIRRLNELEWIYKENSTLISDNMEGGISIKNKVRMFLYDKLHKKLSKKGLI